MDIDLNPNFNDSKQLLFVNDVLRRLGHRVNPWRIFRNEPFSPRRQTTCKHCYCPIYYEPFGELADDYRTLAILLSREPGAVANVIVTWGDDSDYGDYPNEAGLPSAQNIAADSRASQPEVICRRLRSML